MGKVLLVTELGEGLGHLMSLAPVAAALGAAHAVVLASPDPAGAARVLHGSLGLSVRVEAGHRWTVERRRTAASAAITASLADALADFGFADVAVWRKAIAAWSRLLDRERPDLVITESAPGVRLAAAGRTPVLALGNGYSVPPAGRVLPSLQPGTGGVPPGTREREYRMTAAINQAQAERNGFAVDYLADLFNGDQTFIGSLPALDHYRGYRTGASWWPWFVQRPHGLPTDGEGGPVAVAYLHRNHPSLDLVLDLLGRLSETARRRPGVGRAEVYVLGVDPAALAARCRPGVLVRTDLFHLPSLLSRTRLFIHHGGFGSAHEGLAAGVPQLILPLHLEQTMTARALEAAGVAAVVPPWIPGRDDPGGYAARLNEVARQLIEGSHAAAARARAAELAATPMGDAMQAICAAALQAMSGPALRGQPGT